MIHTFNDDLNIPTGKIYKINNININTLYYNYKADATGIPSTIGAGNLSFDNATDYYSATPFTGNVVWTITAITTDKVIAIDCVPLTYTIELYNPAITFLGSINSSRLILNLDPAKSNLISLWAESSTRVWVNVLKNQA